MICELLLCDTVRFILKRFFIQLFVQMAERLRRQTRIYIRFSSVSVSERRFKSCSGRKSFAPGGDDDGERNPSDTFPFCSLLELEGEVQEEVVYDHWSEDRWVTLSESSR